MTAYRALVGIQGTEGAHHCSAIKTQVMKMSTSDLELSRLPKLQWMLEKPWLWLRTLAPRRRATTDIRELSGHLRRDVGIDL